MVILCYCIWHICHSKISQKGMNFSVKSLFSCVVFIWFILIKFGPPSSLRHVQQDCGCDVLSLLYMHNVCLVCMGVFAYVCICFTHQSSSVMSLTWWGAQRGEATCVMRFRPLLESDVTRGEVSGWERRPEESWGEVGGELWQQGDNSENFEKETSQHESGLRASTGHPGQCMCNGRGARQADF